MKRPADLRGKKFGRLKPIERGTAPRAGWQCICECGNRVIVSASHLNSGNTKSCGCMPTGRPSRNGVGGGNAAWRALR